MIQTLLNACTKVSGSVNKMKLSSGESYATEHSLQDATAKQQLRAERRNQPCARFASYIENASYKQKHVLLLHDGVSGSECAMFLSVRMCYVSLRMPP